MVFVTAPTRRETFLGLLFLLALNLHNQVRLANFPFPPSLSQETQQQLLSTFFSTSSSTSSRSAATSLTVGVQYRSTPLLEPQPTSHGYFGQYANVTKQYDTVVHVLHTRFMQHQKDLKHLARARLQLFQTVTLPSVLQQTNPHFLWVIWLDPYLHEQVRLELLQILQDAVDQARVTNPRKPLPHIVILASLAKLPALRQADFWSEQQGTLTASSMYYGNRQMLWDYHQASLSRVVLETVLDADDALFYDFVETVQAEASKTLTYSSFSSGDYRFWCAPKILMWNYFDNHNKKALSSSNKKATAAHDNKDDPHVKTQQAKQNQDHLDPRHVRGRLSIAKYTTSTGGAVGIAPVKNTNKNGATTTATKPPANPHKNTCPTGGFTTGYGYHTMPGDLPAVTRQELQLQTPPCEFSKFQCWSHVHAGAAEWPVLRAVTPASVGVAQVLAPLPPGQQAPKKSDQSYQDYQSLLWKKVATNFGIDEARMIAMRQAMEGNMLAVILDGMQGICTEGHSCKRQDKEALRELKLQYKYAPPRPLPVVNTNTTTMTTTTTRKVSLTGTAKASSLSITKKPATTTSQGQQKHLASIKSSIVNHGGGDGGSTIGQTKLSFTKKKIFTTSNSGSTNHGIMKSSGLVMMKGGSTRTNGGGGGSGGGGVVVKMSTKTASTTTTKKKTTGTKIGGGGGLKLPPSYNAIMFQNQGDDDDDDDDNHNQNTQAAAGVVTKSLSVQAVAS
ncbi:hypothetical protein ACA910_013878 [Epithemia clementina (nom. ined.)]